MSASFNFAAVAALFCRSSSSCLNSSSVFFFLSRSKYAFIFFSLAVRFVSSSFCSMSTLLYRLAHFVSSRLTSWMSNSIDSMETHKPAIISSVLAFAKLAFSYASLSKSSSVIEAPFASFCSKLKTATFAASLAIFIWPNNDSVCAFLASSSRICACISAILFIRLYCCFS